MDKVYDVIPPSIDWTMAMPVIIVICTGVLALLIEMFRPKRDNNATVLLSLAGLVLAGFQIVSQLNLPDGETFSQMVLRDRPALVLQLLLLSACFLSILFSEGYLREKRIAFGEFYALALWSTAGGMIMVSTKSLLMIFMGLEVLSIALYVMAGMSRQENKSEESAIKYFLLGAFASGFLLYGLAFFYGATGGIHLDLLGQAWASNDESARSLMIFGLALTLVGVCFKAAFVPFHQWTPDVYQGAPTNVTAFMAAGSKIAAIGTLYRVLQASIPMQHLWMPALFWIAIITMLVGSVIALLQKDVKRALGYSSISNAGYVLVALLAHFAGSNIGLGSTMFYLLSYTLMTVGTFAVISLTAKSGREGTRFQDLYGLWQRSPAAASALIVLVASLIGVPITAGFFGKLFILQDAMHAGLTPLALVLVISSAISAYYYIGIIRAVFVAPEGAISNESGRMNIGLAATCLICATGTIVISLLATPLLEVASPVGYTAIQKLQTVSKSGVRYEGRQVPVAAGATSR